MVGAVVRKMPYSDVHDDMQTCPDWEAAAVEMIDIKRVIIVM
jgi:hypothetical protein